MWLPASIKAKACLWRALYGEGRLVLAWLDIMLIEPVFCLPSGSKLMQKTPGARITRLVSSSLPNHGPTKRARRMVTNPSTTIVVLPMLTLPMMLVTIMLPLEVVVVVLRGEGGIGAGGDGDDAAIDDDDDDEAY